jgi:hypothetical protein
MLKLSSLAITGAGVGTTAVGSAAARTLEPASGTDLRNTLGNVRDGDTVLLEPGGEYVISDDVTIGSDEWTLVGNGATITGSGSYNTLRMTGTGYNVGGFYVDGPDDWSLRFSLKGGNWEFHNVAWLNEFGSNAQHHVIPTNKADGTTAVIHDLWFGAGLTNGHREGVFKAHPDGTVGDIEVRRCYFFQSGCYATNSSASGSARLQGTIDFYDCYFDSCWHNYIRSGSHDAGPTTVENCVMVADPRCLVLVRYHACDRHPHLDARRSRGGGAQRGLQRLHRYGGWRDRWSDLRLVVGL